jgi:hypothetical protein
MKCTGTLKKVLVTLLEFAKTGKGVVGGSTRQDLCSRFVNCSVARGTHGYKILFRVLSSVASVLQVMDFKSGQ